MNASTTQFTERFINVDIEYVPFAFEFDEHRFAHQNKTSTRLNPGLSRCEHVPRVVT